MIVKWPVSHSHLVLLHLKIYISCAWSESQKSTFALFFCNRRLNTAGPVCMSVFPLPSTLHNGWLTPRRIASLASQQRRARESKAGNRQSKGGRDHSHYFWNVSLSTIQTTLEHGKGSTDFSEIVWILYATICVCVRFMAPHTLLHLPKGSQGSPNSTEITSLFVIVLCQSCTLRGQCESSSTE